MSRKQYDYDLPAHHVDYGVDVKVADLKIDKQAQRTLNEKRAQSISENLVREAIGSIVVSQRADGELYIVDGQHRWRVCELSEIPTIKAEVHHGLTQTEEAVLFLIKNRESHKPNPLDEYKVGLTAGVPLFTDTQAVLTKHGLTMGSTSTNSVGAVSGVLKITQHYGASILDRTFTVAEDAWGRDGGAAWDGMLLGGIGMFLGRHGDIVDDRDLARRLEKEGMAQRWRAKVLTLSSNGGFNNSGTGSRLTACYTMVRDAWNKNRKSQNRIEG